MNNAVETLMFGVTDRVQQAILDLDCPAVVALQGDRMIVLSDFDYLRDRETALAFETRAAEKAREIHAVRFVLAVPQVWREESHEIIARRVSNSSLRKGEFEVIAWTGYDAADGVDYGHVPYTRRPNSVPVFDDPEIFTGRFQARDEHPGAHLLRSLLSGDTVTGSNG
jgi:hypothetical protein